MSIRKVPFACIEPLEQRTLLSAAPRITNHQDLTDTIGADTADPVRDLAYVYDQTAQHILAVNTDAGTTSAVGDTSANVAGLAVSIDDTRLFASEPGAFQIEVFSLPSLTLLKTLNVGVAVQQIVPAANNRIIGDTGQITGFNADTGATLYSMAGDYDGLLRSNAAGTQLYSRARGLSGNDGSVRVWDISGTGNPVADASIPGPTGANSTDFQVDATVNRAYLADGGVNGVEVTAIGNGNQTVWNAGGPIQDLAKLQGSDYTYAADFNGNYSVFDQNGVQTGYGSTTPDPTAESMVITPNGNVLCTEPHGVITLGFMTNITQTPVQQPSVTTLTASATTEPANGGGITFTVNVAATQSGAAVPTGDVIIGVTSESTQTVTLANGSGQFMLNPPVGTYTVSATYNGDTTYIGSSAAPVTVTITPAVSGSSPSTIALSSVSPMSTTFGAPVTFTGTVASSTGSGVTPTGSVTFFDGATPLGTTLVQGDGTFAFATSTLPVGADAVTADYDGDFTYAPAVTAAVTVTVAAGTAPVSANGSVTTVAVTPNPAMAGTMVIFRGSVASASGSATVPTGLVTLFDGDAAIGNAALLADGSFTFTSASLPVGASALTARYLGDSVYTASMSAVFSEVITSGIAPSVGAVVLPASVVAGATFVSKVPVTITNQSADLKGNFTFNLYADANASLDGTQTLLQSIPKSFPLKNGKSKTIVLKPKSLPATLPDGTYHLLAQVIDPTGASTVTTLSPTVQVAAPFVALSATVGPLTPATLVAGKTASVLVTVTNTGNTLAAGTLTVTVGPSTGGETFAPFTHGVKIKPGKLARVKVHFKYDGSLAAGSYFPQAVITLGTVSTTAVGDIAFTI